MRRRNTHRRGQNWGPCDLPGQVPAGSEDGRRGLVRVLFLRARAIGAFLTVSAVAEAQARTTAVAAPVTVADIVGLTTIGSHVRGYGDDDYDVVSLDGAHVAVVVKRGNVGRNTIDYALLVFRTADLMRKPVPDTVAQFATNSNRPGIVHVKWLSDNRTLVFLGECPGKLPQVYTLNTRTRHLTQRTHATTVIAAFDASNVGDIVVYAAEEHNDSLDYAAMRAHGFVVPPRAEVTDAIAGDWGYAEPSLFFARDVHTLHVVRRDEAEATIPLPDSAGGYQSCNSSGMSVAPGGDVVLVQCTPRTVPPAWAQYRQHDFVMTRAGFVFPVYLVLDLRTGRVWRLSDAPIALFSSAPVWSPNGRSIALNTVLPLNVADPAERAARAAHTMVAEIDVHTCVISVIAASGDSLNVVSWNPRSGTIELAGGVSLNEMTRRYYMKTTAGWGVVSAEQAHVATPAPALIVDQGMNTPWRLVAVDLRTKARHVVYDPNPRLMTTYRLTHEDVIHWQTKTGAKWAGGLYWPLDYVPKKRYALIIQTHGFDSTAFWPEGVFATGEAAQPLAGKGLMVLQMTSAPSEDQLMTPQEAPLAEEGAEAAIDYLDSLGLIDRTKVGMQAFSRTCFYTLYLLTHSRYSIAAATITDGVDMSYLQYLVFQPSRVGWNEDIKINGGLPFGPPLATWRERAPGFNLDRVTTPLQFTAIGRESLLAEWEPYAGLLLQGKPAEMVYIPDGSHILVKPWERLTSQQGAVDWYLFWLKGEEDPDPAKSEQYARWHVLRAMQDSSTAKTATARGR